MHPHGGLAIDGTWFILSPVTVFAHEAPFTRLSLQLNGYGAGFT
jgi:hypothetical protein